MYRRGAKQKTIKMRRHTWIECVDDLHNKNRPKNRPNWRERKRQFVLSYNFESTGRGRREEQQTGCSLFDTDSVSLRFVLTKWQKLHMVREPQPRPKMEKRQQRKTRAFFLLLSRMQSVASIRNAFRTSRENIERNGMAQPTIIVECHIHEYMHV